MLYSPSERRNLIAAVNAVEAAEATNTLLLFESWIFHNSGSPNSCHLCIDHTGTIYRVSSPMDLLTVFPDGVFVAEDTFACNIHPHCACFLVKM